MQRYKICEKLTSNISSEVTYKFKDEMLNVVILLHHFTFIYNFCLTCRTCLLKCVALYLEARTAFKSKRLSKLYAYFSFSNVSLLLIFLQ